MQKHHSYSESCIRFHDNPDIMMFVPDYMASMQEDAQASPLEYQEGSSLQASQAPSQIAPQASPQPASS